MLKKILSIDKIIHTQQFGLEWEPTITLNKFMFNKDLSNCISQNQSI